MIKNQYFRCLTIRINRLYPLANTRQILNATLANIQQNLVAALLSSDDALRFASREFDLQVNY
jgi:hypothetical protein